jgi:ribosomal protein S19E (S16A)
MLDWIAVQRLKTFGYIEERSTGLAVTEEGRRAIRRLGSDH